MEFCLSCATPIDGPAPSCAACGCAHDSHRYHQLAHMAREYAEFGLLYRIRYERQLRQHGRIIEMYSLAVSDWLIFVCIAALSGIIGNVAHEVVKKVLVRLAPYGNASDRAVLHSVRADSTCIDPPFVSEEDILLLIAFLEEYRAGLPGVHPIVRHAIEEEKAIKQSLVGMSEMIRKIYDQSGKYESEGVDLRVDARPELKHPLRRDDFEGLWQEIERNSDC